MGIRLNRMKHKLNKLFWKLPMVWRFKYKYYHEQFIEPPAAKTEPSIKWQITSAKFVEPTKDDYRFRCPNCGQAHTLLIDGFEHIALKQDHSMTKLWMQVGSFQHQQDSDIWKHTMDWNIFGIAAKIECVDCKMGTPRWMWQDAFKRPLMFFEMENLCQCGGETYYQQIPGSDRFGAVCERCSRVKPGAVISGSEGDQ